MEQFDKFAMFLARVVGWALVAAALAAWAYQAYFFLRSGFRIDYGLTSVVREYGSGELQIWALFPQTWVGLHYLLSFVPTPLIAIIVGGAIVAKTSD